MADFACANIGPKQSRLRMAWGVMLTLIAIGVGGYCWLTGQPWYVRAGAVFIPAYFAVLGFLEVRCRTCVLLAEMGRQNMDKASEWVVDEAQARRLRHVARRIYWQSLTIAAPVTAAYLCL